MVLTRMCGKPCAGTAISTDPSRRAGGCLYGIPAFRLELHFEYEINKLAVPGPLTSAFCLVLLTL